MKHQFRGFSYKEIIVVPYIGTWIETLNNSRVFIQLPVVPYIGTWIETFDFKQEEGEGIVVPYIGTWIETAENAGYGARLKSYLI